MTMLAELQLLLPRTTHGKCRGSQGPLKNAGLGSPTAIGEVLSLRHVLPYLHCKIARISFSAWPEHFKFLTHTEETELVLDQVSSLISVATWKLKPMFKEMCATQLSCSPSQ